MITAINPKQAEEHFVETLDTLTLAFSSCQGDSIPHRYTPIEPLLKKIIYNGFSLLSVAQTKTVSLTNNEEFLIQDFTATNIILRSILEAYLVLFWTSFDPKDNNEAYERILIWQLTDICSRYNIANEYNFKINNNEKDKESKFKILHQLHLNPFFLNRAEEERNTFLYTILKKGMFPKGYKPSWFMLISASKLDSWFGWYYKLLCSHAHSGFISASQIQSWSLDSIKPDMVSIAYTIATTITSILTKELIDIFPCMESFFKLNPKRLEKIEYYSNVASGHWERNEIL